MDWDSVAAFLLAAVVIQVTPGPGMLFILTQGMTGGGRAGGAAACGAAAAMLVHTTAIALGLAALLNAAPVAMEVLRIGGSAYLAWLAIQAFRSRNGTPGTRDDLPEDRFGRVFLRAAINNLTNPKIAIFYLTFLPLFVNPSLGHVPIQLFILGLVLLTVGFVVDLAIGMSAGRARRLMVGRWAARGALHKIAGTIYGALAVRLVTSS